MAYATKIGNILIQGGWAIKNQIDLQINFSTVFGGIPAVVVTSEWQNAGVGYVETIYGVNSAGFRVHSGNKAPNYYVNWMAIGPVLRSASLTREMEEVASAFRALDRSDEELATKESYNQESEQTKGLESGTL
jgi:hypothetical protein